MFITVWAALLIWAPWRVAELTTVEKKPHRYQKQIFKGYGEEDTAVSDSDSYQTIAYYKILKGFSPGWLGIQ